MCPVSRLKENPFVPPVMIPVVIAVAFMPAPVMALV